MSKTEIIAFLLKEFDFDKQDAGCLADKILSDGSPVTTRTIEDAVFDWFDDME